MRSDKGADGRDRRERIRHLKQELIGDMLTTAEVAEILEVHPRTVGEYVRDGRLRAIEIGGSWRISEQALREFVTFAAATSPAGRGKKRKGRGRDRGMFKRFSDQARQVTMLAQEEAQELNHSYVGTEHLLLALLRPESGVAYKALENLGLTGDAVREDVVGMLGHGRGMAGGHRPFTPAAKQVLAVTLRQALRMKHNWVGTEHLLLALGEVEAGGAAQILTRRGVTIERIEEEVLGLIGDVGQGG